MFKCRGSKLVVCLILNLADAVMAGKRFPTAGNSRSSFFSLSVTSFIFLGGLTVVAFASLLFFSPFSYSSPPPPRCSSTLFHPTQHRSKPTVDPDYSFVSSLEKLLSSHSPLSHDDSAEDGATTRDLDEKMWAREAEGLDGRSSEPWWGMEKLKVYVYEMPSKFTYDLLRLFRDTYKDTSNLTSNGSPVHRLIEQHSVDYWLWADLIAPESERLLKNVVRVQRQKDADVFYLPFFTSISYFLLEKQQCMLLYRVWERTQGGFEVGY